MRSGSRTHEPEGPELEPDAFDHSAMRMFVYITYDTGFIKTFFSPRLSCHTALQLQRTYIYQYCLKSLLVS